MKNKKFMIISFLIAVSVTVYGFGKLFPDGIDFFSNPTPGRVYYDSGLTEGVPAAQIFVDCSDPTANSEDCEAYIYAQRDGIMSLIGAFDPGLVYYEKLSAMTLTSASFNVETTDTGTLYVLTIASLSGDQVGVLPAATGAGGVFGFFLVDGDSTYDFRIDVDGVDQIITTSASGDYIGADAAGDLARLTDVALGFWMLETMGTWTEE